MIKICFLVLTLNSGQPALINANEVITVSQVSVFGVELTDIYLKDRVFSVTEKVEEIADKLKQCNPLRGGDSFIYVK